MSDGVAKFQGEHLVHQVNHALPDGLALDALLDKKTGNCVLRLRNTVTGRSCSLDPFWADQCRRELALLLWFVQGLRQVGAVGDGA